MSGTSESSESSTGSEEDYNTQIDSLVEKSLDCMDKFEYDEAEKSMTEAYSIAETHREEIPRVLSKYFLVLYITKRRDVRVIQDTIASLKKADDGKEILDRTEKEVVAEMDGLYRKYRNKLAMSFYAAINPFPGLLEKVKETKGIDLKSLVRYLDLAKGCKGDIKGSVLADLSVAAFHNFSEYYSTVDAKSLRSIDEKALRKFNDLLQGCLKGSEYKQFIKLEVEMALDFVCSEYVGKQYDGLLTLSKITLSKEMIEAIRKKDIMGKVLSELHRDLVQPFAKVMSKLFLGGFYDKNMMEEFWKVSLAQPVAVQDAFFGVWPLIFSAIPSKSVDDFWAMVKTTESFPEPLRKLLQKLAGKCRDTKSVFDVLWNASVGENREAYVSVITAYIPSDFEKYCEVKDKAFELIKEKKDALFAVMLLTSIWKDTSTASTKAEFDLLLTYCEGFDANGFVSLFKLIKKVAKAFTQSLDDNEIKKLEEMSEKAIAVDSLIVNSFFKDLTKMNKGKLLKAAHLQELLRWISTMKAVDARFFDLFSFIFNELNKSLLTKEQISYTQLKGLNELWTLVGNCPLEEAAQFCVKLVAKSDNLEADVADFVERCMQSIEKKGYLLTLAILVRKIEWSMDLTGFNLHRNGFINSSSLIKVNLTKDYVGTVKVPASITTEEFMAKVETLTNVKRTKLTVTIKDKLLSSTHKFKEDETFKVVISKDASAPVKLFTKKCSLPSQIVKNSPKFAKMKEFLTSEDGELAELCLKLLNYIETFDDEMKIFRSISDKVNWDELLSMEHPYLLLYRLNLLANIIDEKNKDYIRTFFESGGYRKLVTLLFSLERGYFKDVEYANLLISTIVALHKAAIDPEILSLKSRDLNEIGIENSIDSLIGWISNSLKSNPRTAAILISVLCDFLTEIKHISWEQEKFSNFYDLTMFCDVERIRRRSVKLFATMDPSESLSLFLSKLDRAANGHCAQYFDFLSHLLKNCNDLMPPWHLLIEHLDSNLLVPREDLKIPDSYSQDMKVAISMLRAKTPHSCFVSGVVSTLYHMVNRMPEDENIEEERLLDILLMKIAFNMNHYVPTPENLFLLAIRLLKRKKSLIPKVLSEMEHIQDDIQGLEEDLKHLEDTVDIERGLVNLGCTCYLNASMQQIFRIPEVRNAVFSYAAPEGTDVSEDWLSQLQLLWAKMLYFPKKSIDTTPFTSVWKDWGGNRIDPMEQQDAVEFVQGLLDKIDEAIPEKPTSKAVRGTIEHTISGISCGFTTSNTEDFVVFPLEVSGQSTFEESFEAFQVPDMFVENNQYKSDEYGLIDAKRTHAIAKAPNTLIFQLKRFDFDLTTLRRKKLTKEYNVSLEVDISSLLVEPPADPVIYELTGIVQHSGSAQGGHYFSYIKVGDEWLTFNDERVTPIKESTVLDNAKGGSTLQHVFDDKFQATNVIKANRMDSAYLLFYRKKGTAVQDTTDPITLMPEPAIREFFRLYKLQLMSSMLFSNKYSVFVSFLVSSNCPETVRFLFDQALKSACGRDGKANDSIWTSALKRAEDDRDFAQYCLEHHQELISYLKTASPKSAKMLTTLMSIAMRACPDASSEFVSHLLEELPSFVSPGEKMTQLLTPVLAYVKEIECNRLDILDSLFAFLDGCSSYDNKFFKTNDFSLVFQIILAIVTKTKDDVTKYKAIMNNEKFVTRWLMSEMNVFDVVMIVTFFLINDKARTEQYFEQLISKKDMDAKRLACHFACALYWKDDLVKYRIEQFLAICKTSEWKTSKRAQFLEATAEKLSTMPQSHCDEIFQNLQWLHDWLLHTNYSLRQACVHFVYALLRSYPPFKANSSRQTQRPVAQIQSPEEEKKCFRLMYEYLTKCSKELISISRKGAAATSSTGRPNPTNVPIGSFFELLAWAGFYGEVDMSQNLQVFMSILSGISSLKGDMKRPVIDVMHFLSMFKLIDESHVSQLLSYVSKTPSSSSQAVAFREYIDDVSKYLWPLLDPVASKCGRTIIKSRIFEYSVERCIGDVNPASVPLSAIISTIATNDNMKKVAKRVWKSHFFAKKMKEKCIAYFNLTIKLLGVGPAAIKEFKRHECFPSVASQILVLHENNNQSWTFWDQLVTILQIVTQQERDRHAKKILAFWKVYDGVPDVLNDVLQKPTITRVLFEHSLELLSTLGSILKGRLMKLIENADPDFIARIPKPFLSRYFEFLLSVVPRDATGQALLLKQLQRLNAHEICDADAFATLASGVVDNSTADLVELISTYLNNCNNAVGLGGSFTGVALAVARSHHDVVHAWRGRVATCVQATAPKEESRDALAAAKNLLEELEKLENPQSHVEEPEQSDSTTSKSSTATTSE